MKKENFKKISSACLAALLTASMLFASACSDNSEDTNAPWTTEAPETIPWTTDDIESNIVYEDTEPVEDVTDTFETNTPETDAPETLVGPGYELSDGTLTILNDDAMTDFEFSEEAAAWYAQRESITKVVISDGVTKIGKFAFCDCTNLSSVEIPSSVTRIKTWAFAYCESLKEIVIPNGVETIDGDAFRFSGLESITLPDTLKHLDDLAFCDCRSLTSITIPANVEKINNNVFYDCRSLTKVTVDENNKYFSSDDRGVLFNKDKTTIMYYPEGNSNTEYTIPNGVTVIGEEAFRASKLKSIVIPDSVKTICEGAFIYSNYITKIIIPDGVTTIESATFHVCVGLESVVIPDSVTSIDDNAFNRCVSLKSVVIPYGVTAIKESTFESCRKLESIAIPASVKTIGDMAFFSCENLKEINFKGTKAQWEAIEKDEVWDLYMPEYTVNFGA